MESLLKNQDGVGMMILIADYVPNDEGLLATYTLRYNLNDDFVLLVYQDHYARGKSPLKGNIIESKAKIIKIKYTSKHEQA